MGELVKIHGLKELDRNLRQLSDALGPRASGKIYTNALKKGGWVIAKEAKRRAPVLKQATPWRKAGAIKASITSYSVRWNVIFVRVRNRGEPARARRERRKVNPGADSPGNAHYWWRVEFGDSKRPAQPFLRPAYEAQKYAALAAVKAELQKGIAKAIVGMARTLPRAA